MLKFYWLWIERAFPWPYSIATGIAFFLGVVMPLIAKRFPKLEHHYHSLLWKIPLCIFIILFFFRLIIAPYELYQNKEHNLEMVKKELETERDNKIVKLSGEIRKVVTVPSSNKTDILVLFTISITNTGAEGAVKDYWAKVSFGAQVFDLQHKIIPDSGLTVHDTTFFPMHAIDEKTSESIKRGVTKSGVILFVFKDGIELRHKFKGINPTWTLGFSDYLGKNYDIHSKSHIESQSPFLFKERKGPIAIGPVPGAVGSDR